MTTNRTAEDVLGDNFEAEPAGYFNFEQAKQQLLADILSLPCLQDEIEDVEDLPFEYGKQVGGNEKIIAARRALQDYFMGGDVGVAGGSPGDSNGL